MVTADFVKKVSITETDFNHKLAAAEADFTKKLLVADKTIAKERRRADRSDAVKEELTVDRNRIVLQNVDLVHDLRVANATVAGFQRQKNEALKKKHQQFEMEGAAIVRAELDKRTSALEQQKRREVEQLAAGMKTRESQMLVKMGAMEVELKNQRAQTNELKEDNLMVVKELSETRRKLKLMEKRAGVESEQIEDEDITGRLADAAIIEKLHAEFSVWCCLIIFT